MAALKRLNAKLKKGSRTEHPRGDKSRELLRVFLRGRITCQQAGTRSGGAMSFFRETLQRKRRQCDRKSICVEAGLNT